MELNQNFKGRDFISLHDYSQKELLYFLDVADFLKKQKKAGGNIEYLKGKTLGMIFQKSSTRTRVSFETGIYYLGGIGLFLSSSDLQIGRGEPVADTARVLARYLNGIMIRTFSHKEVLDLAKYADIPVINGLTDLLHPCQALADMQTAREYKGSLKGLKMAFIGDGNNVTHSLMYAGAKFGMEVSIACPAGYEPNAEITASAVADAKVNGGAISIVRDPNEAAKDADIIYTDVWASMGQEGETQKRRQAFVNYKVDDALLAKAAKDVMVMHCLPAHRGEEITDSVMEGPHSAVFDEAENRLYTQMAIMALLI